MEVVSAIISSGGRIVIPAEFRRELGLNVGDEVIVQIKDGELRIITPLQAIRHAQETVARYFPVDRSLSQELIAERREEANRE